MNAQFKKLCSEEIGSRLRAFDFKAYEFRSDAFGAEVVYTNATTGISIRVEPREFRIFVTLYRLTDGRLPEYTSLRAYDSDLNRFDFDDLISLRAPSAAIQQECKRRLAPKVIRDVLCRYGELLITCGRDVLAGEFEVFADLRKIVERRRKEWNRKARK